MGKEYSLQEALKLAVQTEKDSMDFYRRAASVTKNERAKKVFELLANEEVGHLKSFLEHYKGTEFGDLKSFIDSPPNAKSATIMALEKAIKEDTPEQQALEIAMKEEKSGIQQYSLLVKDIIDPLVRGVFERVIKESQGHYDMIEDEYMHIMGMVDKSDQDTYVRE
ncbi:ferritin-like domain-containing protein [Geobacter argillaceus]|uniref:Rubrerythrin n=1 Tax=Geobacter argillaceus TaxID=345631 RepID=A0A562WU37_9BACT|nr:ferritin family protein [Geobacter argillaceus]TWJ33522.1 rubrerythrin [Geobacter argillaceus]